MKSTYLLDIAEERDRQDKKFGENQHHTLEKWYTILGEEMGELAKAILEKDLKWKKEAIHVAAVAIAMIEAIELREK